MITFITNLFRTQFLKAITKVKPSDMVDNTEKVLNKALQKKEQLNKEKHVEMKKEKKNKENLFYKFPFTFFYSDGKFQPIYFWVTVFSFLSSLMLYIKIYSAWVAIKNKTFIPEMLSTGDLGVVLGFIGSLILLYNSNKVKKNKEGN